jgi:hypothetical protein
MPNKHIKHAPASYRASHASLQSRIITEQVDIAAALG